MKRYPPKVRFVRKRDFFKATRNLKGFRLCKGKSYIIKPGAKYIA